jgi:putative transcriptional regulator
MSKILDVAHEMARDLVKAGAMDEVTMRKMDALCLPRKRPFTARQTRRIRTNNHVSPNES